MLRVSLRRGLALDSDWEFQIIAGADLTAVGLVDETKLELGFELAE